MRKLNTQDIFNFTKVMKAANLKKELQPLFMKGNKIRGTIKNSVSTDDEDAVNNIEPSDGESDNENDIEGSIRMLGIEVILTIMEACGNTGVEDRFYRFLAGPFEMDDNEIRKLSIEALFEKLEQLARENNLIYFFKRAANLTTT